MAVTGVATRMNHDIIKTGDPDAHRHIQDRNGEVVLAECRRCGQAEGTLDPDCHPFDFAALRRANRMRIPLFRDAHGRRVHNHDGSDWTLLEWCAALCGEAGELCAEVADLEEDDEAPARVASELADVACYADIVAFRAGLEPLALDVGYGYHKLVADDAARGVSYAADALANLAKKARRGDLTPDEMRPRVAGLIRTLLANLLAVARAIDADLLEVTRQKFNEVSRRIMLDMVVFRDGSIEGADVARPAAGTRVVALLGLAGAGKSAVATMLEEHAGAKRYSFAYLLKKIVMRAFDLNGAQVFGTQAQKEAVDPRYGVSGRWLLQRVGTEGVRATLGPDFWVRATLAQIAQDAPALAVIDDCRFANEAALVRAAGGHVCRVTRGAQDVTTGHASETEVARAYDAQIDDAIVNDGTLDQLRTAVLALAKLRQLT